jgi:hypothetical protein
MPNLISIANWTHLLTLFNAESSGIHGRACFHGNRGQGEERRAAAAIAVGPNPPLKETLKRNAGFSPSLLIHHELLLDFNLPP